MSTLEDRLRHALAPEYRVEHELARGGSAVVYLATEVALDRPVAIKVLRPELATARGSARFLREARLLAHVAHPNVVPVHRAGEADGLFFYVMDHLEDETLRELLARGPISAEETLAVARDLLDALEAAHRTGVVHRDVKPGNILLRGHRALLADFGIAGESGMGRNGASDLPDAPPSRLGTPGYMAPEQAEGADPTAASDLYALGMVLYEALTGRRWHLATSPDRADWTGVPQALVPALRTALEPDPAERWPDAAAFRGALPATPRPRRARGRRAAAAALVALAVSAIILLRISRRGAADTRLADVAILPCVPSDERDSALARSTARIAALDLVGFAHLRVRSPFTSFRWWSRRGAPAGVREAPTALQVKRVVACTLARPAADTLEARLELVDGDGASLPLPDPVRGPAADPPQALGDSVALALVRRLGRTLSSDGISVLGGLHVQPVSAFLRGEDDFEAGDWAAADSAYTAALSIEPDFALARWRLADVHRWEVLPSVNLEPLRRTGGAGLGPLDRRLLATRLLPPGPTQFDRYRDILREYPRDAYATMLFADELYHRGPLWGIPLDSAVDALELAVARDSFFQPAWEHLTEARIRLGQRQAAAEALRRLDALDRASASGPSPMTAVLRQAWTERFDPTHAPAGREALFGSRPDPAVLLHWNRLAGPTLDLDRAELELGRALVAVAGAWGRARLSGHMAQGLAHMAAGRPRAAFAQLDSAAALSAEDRAAVEAAEWRVVPAALGVPGIPEAAVETARRRLVAAASSGTASPGARREARWALALDAYRRLALDEGDRWARELGGPSADSLGGRLRSLLDAVRRGARGDADGALEVSAPLQAYDSAGSLEAPFSRAALHLLRAEWEVRADRPAAGLASLTWQENSDLEGAPGEMTYAPPLVQAGEVDWALGSEGRLRGADAAVAAGRTGRACRYAQEVLRLWAMSEPSLGPSVDRARSIREQACPR